MTKKSKLCLIVLVLLGVSVVFCEHPESMRSGQGS